MRTESTRNPNLQAAGEALAAVFETGVVGADGRIRVEDLLSAAAAVCGEACIAAAGEFDPADHTYPPGSAVLSQQVNHILCADGPDWDQAGDSVFGIIRAGALAKGYEPAHFPPILEPIEQYVASLVSPRGDPQARWGRVGLSVPEDNWPRVQPLRHAFELRAAAARVYADLKIDRADRPSACAIALAIELGRVRQAIDPNVAIRIVLETVNGMAKMAPMTERHSARQLPADQEGKVPIRWPPMEMTDRLRALADVLPVLEASDADFGHWELPPPRDGVHSLGWFEFGPTAEAWRRPVATGDWIVVGFDWRSWLASDEGRSLRDDRTAIASATPEQLGWLLTAIVRSDRFTEGSIAGAFESGLLAAISRRAIGLLDDG